MLALFNYYYFISDLLSKFIIPLVVFKSFYSFYSVYDYVPIKKSQIKIFKLQYLLLTALREIHSTRRNG